MPAITGDQIIAKFQEQSDEIKQVSQRAEHACQQLSGAAGDLHGIKAEFSAMKFWIETEFATIKQRADEIKQRADYQERGQRVGQDRDRRLLEAKHLMPDRFGTEKGSPWKTWKREVIEFVQYKMPELALAIEKIA